MKSIYSIFFSNLSSNLRIDIITALKEKRMCVMELSKILQVEQSKLSHALASLKKCNIVHVKQKGKQRVYSLNKVTILPILQLIDKHAKFHCGGKCGNCKNC